jgi:large subunit ribosomal protein L23
VDIYQVIREPLSTEKTTLLKNQFRQISLKVNKGANKIEIRQAVETFFKTKVVDVSTMNVRGKRRRVGKNVGKRPDWKKAIVTLAPGEDLEIFEGV